MPQRSVTHEGRETVYRIQGEPADGGAVVCVHGAGASQATWARQFRLADDRPIAALDLSGHGASDEVDAAAGWETLAAYATDTRTVLEEVDASFLVGHSMGAAVVLHLLERQAYDLQGVVLCGMGTRFPVHDDILSMAANDFEGLVDFLHAKGRLFHDPTPELVRASREAMQACGQAVTLRDFETCDTIDFRDTLSTVDIPTLVMTGEHDKLTPPAANERLASNLQAGMFTTIDEAAHMPMLEQPHATNTHLSRFFTSPDAAFERNEHA